MALQHVESRQSSVSSESWRTASVTPLEKGSQGSDHGHRETHPILDISLAAETTVTEKLTRSSKSVSQLRPRSPRNSPDPRNQSRSRGICAGVKRLCPAKGETRFRRRFRRSSHSTPNSLQACPAKGRTRFWRRFRRGLARIHADW